MLSDVQWTALPALLPPTPGESQWGMPGDSLGLECPELVWVPKQTVVHVSGSAGSFGGLGRGRGV